MWPEPPNDGSGYEIGIQEEIHGVLGKAKRAAKINFDVCRWSVKGSSNVGTVRPGFLRWWSVVAECGGVRRSVVECGGGSGVWWSVVE